MAFNPHAVKMNRVKDVNAREKRRLDHRITGHAGIESQQKLKTQQTQQECDLLRKDLAKIYFTDKCKPATRNREHWNIRSLFDNDTSLLMMEERENIRRRKNRKLLCRAKQKDKLMEGMVKEFVAKLEVEKVLQDNPKIVGANDQNEISTNILPERSIDVAGGSDNVNGEIPYFRSSSHVWQEAQNTRYVRTRVLRDFEIELTPKEVFGENGL